MAQVKKPPVTKIPGVPVVWKTTKATADRLLGKSGRPVLDNAISIANEVAARRKWPLKRLKVEYYEDPEVARWHTLNCGIGVRLQPRGGAATQYSILARGGRSMEGFKPP